MKLVLGIVAALMLLLPVVSADYLYLYPQSNTSYSEWTPKGCSLNYQCVDENPINTNDFVYTPYDDELDVYDFSFGAGGFSGTINSVRVEYYAKRYSDTHKHVNFTLVNWGSKVESVKVMLGSSYTTHYFTHYINPVTSSAWTWFDLQSLGAGVRSISEGGGFVARTRIRVFYTP
ncbi:hypothetical protein AUJ65_00580 [Candidatus Micrarchaeota archaeon CG1_02_51_15]|nr:MAG: hypothetical protein AUJ65_00580 [Candidatus Micrarchaeota archaeon CG1_02_51_15]